MTAQEPSAKSLTKSLRKTLAAFLTMLLLFTSLPAAMLEKAGVNTSFLPDSVAYASPVDVAECDFAATYGLGDTLRLADGSTSTAGSVFDETLDAPVKVYNFEVEGLHTYYVGGSVQVLVHNNVSISELATTLTPFSNNQLSVTRAGKLREIGMDVISTSTVGNPLHTSIIPKTIPMTNAERKALSSVFERIPNDWK
jgi:hypothetical protein